MISTICWLPLVVDVCFLQEFMFINFMLYMALFVLQTRTLHIFLWYEINISHGNISIIQFLYCENLKGIQHGSLENDISIHNKYQIFSCKGWREYAGKFHVACWNEWKRGSIKCCDKHYSCRWDMERGKWWSSFLAIWSHVI